MPKVQEVQECDATKMLIEPKAGNKNKNMKKIADYIHLYLGCECYWEVEGDKGTITLYGENLARAINLNWKPILRKLNSMTEEEKKGAPIVAEDKDMFALTFYLLSLHFDLFQLIEAGLALDKTKLKEVPG